MRTVSSRSAATRFEMGSASLLPGKELAKLLDFLKTRKEKGAVEIDGKKWAVSTRYIFPSELVWAKAFRQEE